MDGFCAFCRITLLYRISGATHAAALAYAFSRTYLFAAREAGDYRACS